MGNRSDSVRIVLGCGEYFCLWGVEMKGLAICKTCGTDHSDNGGKCRGLFGIQPEPVWSGEGLPPIGCVCEYRGNDTSWGEVKIIGHDEGKVVFKPSGEDYYGITPSHKAEFIPIRAPEDVARDEFIKELSGRVISGFSIGTKFAAALYDAGYRKME